MAENLPRHPELAMTTSLWQELQTLRPYVSRRRKQQLLLLLFLLILSGLSEVFGVASIFPFLLALNDTQRLLESRFFRPLLTFLGINTPYQVLVAVIFTFILITIITNLMRVLTVYVQNTLAGKIGSDLSAQVYRKVITQPYIFYTQYHSSELALPIGFANGLAVGFFMPVLAILANGVVTIALFMGVLFIDGKVALISAAVLGVAYGILYQWRKKNLQENSSALVTSTQESNKLVYESLGGIKDILLADRGNFFTQNYVGVVQVINQIGADNQTIFTIPRYLIEMIAMICIALLALSMGRSGDFSRSVPVLGSLALTANRLLPAVQQIFYSVSAVQVARDQLRNVLSFLDRDIDPIQTLHPSAPISLKHELRLENLWFRYQPEGKWILQDLSLTIPARSRVGFVGTTGSGKSTTADVILGLLHPEKGGIYVDGKPLEGERLRAWQLGIAHVPQAIFIADTTIASNIAFGLPESEIDMAQVQKAAYLARISEFIESLDKGYDTFVGERGIRLSGGQRQRIGIARALYRQASVIVFDEATSALDNSTEREVMQAIEQLSDQLTIILIAHRLTTIEKCDVIYEFQNGRVIHQGTYGELLARSATFRKMVTGEIAIS
jgi:ATP-binding cassette subfamily B protein